MSTMQIIWFGVLFAAILVWFALASRLLSLLKDDHHDVYESLGSPSLVANNSVKNNWLSLRFLMSGAYRSIEDDRVSRLCRFMRLFLVLYTVWFIGPLAWALFAA